MGYKRFLGSLFGSERGAEQLHCLSESQGLFRRRFHSVAVAAARNSDYVYQRRG